MGSGSSYNKKKQANKCIQVSPAVEVQSQSPVFRHVRKQPVKPPNPDERFVVETNIEDYSSIWDQDTKLSSTFQKSVKVEKVKPKHHQKDSFSNEKTKRVSNKQESAEVESEINSKSQGSVHFSTSDKIDEYIQNINRIHTELDNKIKVRNEQISNDTESVLFHIRNETEVKQQRLLTYAREQEQKQEHHYQQLVQEYINQLDQQKVRDLSQLHNELKCYQDQIFEESQLKILTVNEQANITKARIVQTEQEQALTQIDSIISQIQKISTDDKFQSLGSEILTQTSINTKASFGSKLPDKS